MEIGNVLCYHDAFALYQGPDPIRSFALTAF
jgi:hypothetical protein